MVNFKSGLWSTKENYHCMWKDERPDHEDSGVGVALYYLPVTEKWSYQEIESTEDDFLITDWPLTSWEE